MPVLFERMLKLGALMSSATRFKFRPWVRKLNAPEVMVAAVKETGAAPKPPARVTLALKAILPLATIFIAVAAGIAPKAAAEINHVAPGSSPAPMIPSVISALLVPTPLITIS